MKKILSLIFILISSGIVQAETVYVTDNISLTVRRSENNRSKIVKMVRSGTRMTVISRNADSGYTKVRLKNGREGYILTSHTRNSPISRTLLKETKQQIQLLQEENNRLKEEFNSLKGNNLEASSSNQTLIIERDKLSSDLERLSQTAANAVQLKHQRDQLQERVVNVERELQQVKRKNQALEDSTNQDWFLYGGMLSFIGIFLGLLLPKISWHRKTSNWDTF